MNASKRRSTRSLVHMLSAVILAGLSLLSSRPARGEYAAEPLHLIWADELVTNIAPENNEYGSGPSYVQWAGVNGATEYRSRSLCSTFVTNVLKQAYGLSTQDIVAWFGSTSPNAILYHNRIVNEIGFEEIRMVDEIVAGDIVAIKYPEGSSVTGHVAITAGAPVPRVATTPIVPGTTQYEITILDSSSTGHGLTDTRITWRGSWHAGVGKGVMRLYANRSGVIVGYTWSTQSASVYYPKQERDIVLGRITEL